MRATFLVTPSDQLNEDEQLNKKVRRLGKIFFVLAQEYPSNHLVFEGKKKKLKKDHNGTFS